MSQLTAVQHDVLLRRPLAGRAVPLTEDDLSSACEALDLGVAELWAVLQVETRGAGFYADRRPVILFERHKFSELTQARFDAGAAHLSSPVPGAYGGPGAHQYERLEQAMSLDADAALSSTSWGLGQIMGFNARRAGFDSVNSMVIAMSQGEGLQLAALTNFLQTCDCARLLRQRNWTAFAARYNGARYAEHRYDVRLAQAHQRLLAGPLPDLLIREAQMRLMFQGYRPGMVDGVWGKFTASALQEFVRDRKLTIEATAANLPRLIGKLATNPLH
jgi:N-acetylmuramidase